MKDFTTKIGPQQNHVKNINVTFLKSGLSLRYIMTRVSHADAAKRKQRNTLLSIGFSIKLPSFSVLINGFHYMNGDKDFAKKQKLKALRRSSGVIILGVVSSQQELWKGGGCGHCGSYGLNMSGDPNLRTQAESKSKLENLRAVISL